MPKAKSGSASPSVWFRTLGCAKNESDSSQLQGALVAAGYTLAANAETADVVVVNTCAFIEDARKESVGAVLEEAANRSDSQTLVVAGCLVERYREDLTNELPEVDAFLTLGAYSHAVETIGKARGGVRQLCFDDGKVPLDMSRQATPSSATAYLKISEGCDRVCTFCAIPLIRGPHRSRAIAEIITEAQWLATCGVKEIILVGQDMSLYGRDLTGKWMLPELLRQMSHVSVDWVRTLYHYPRFVNDELLSAMAASRNAVPYLDLSLQHSSGRMVSAMKRWGDGDRFLAMIERIRTYLPDVVLRSAFITGFPSERESDVEHLAEFLEQAEIDWPGFFVYSPEENTEAFDLKRRVSRAEAVRRADALTEIGAAVSERKREALVGESVEVLVESFDGDEVVGRTWREAPEVDALVRVVGARSARKGDKVEALVSSVDGLDLLARSQAAHRRRVSARAV